MSWIKCKRVKDGFVSNRVLQQAHSLNPVVTVNGEQYLEINPIQLSNNQNPQTNFLYFILPNDANSTQAEQHIQTVYLVPSVPQQSNELPNINSVTKNKKRDDVILIDDDDSNSDILKIEEHEISDDFDQDCDPLEIREHVSYAVAKPYNEAIQEESVENVIKHDEFTWRTQISCDYPQCKVVLTSHYEKKIHMDDHTFPANSTFKCNICNMVFSKAIDRNKHVDSHAVPDIFECDVCLKRFPYYTSYMDHLHVEKCARSKSLNCCVCKVKFASIEDLQSHKELIKSCVCDDQFCSAEMFNWHCNVCPQFQKKWGYTNLQKQLISDEIIVLD